MIRDQIKFILVLWFWLGLAYCSGKKPANSVMSSGAADQNTLNNNTTTVTTTTGNDNDANAAALGEKTFGQGRRSRDFIYMTLSAGIGGGIVAGGKLLEGASFVAGEVGHMTIVPFI